MLGRTKPLIRRGHDGTGIAHGAPSPRVDMPEGAVKVPGGFVAPGDGPACRVHPVVDLHGHGLPVRVRSVRGGRRCRSLRGRAHVGAGCFSKGSRELDQDRQVVQARSQRRQFRSCACRQIASTLVVIEAALGDGDVALGEFKPVLDLTRQAGREGASDAHEFQLLPCRCEVRAAVLLARRKAGPGTLVLRVLDGLLGASGVPAQLPDEVPCLLDVCTGNSYVPQYLLRGPGVTHRDHRPPQ